MDAIAEDWPLIMASLLAVGQGSRNSLAAAIGTIAIETASTFKPVREAFWLTETWRINNLRYWPFYGRGYIQLTWDYNYRSVGDAIRQDLVNNPDLAMVPQVAALVFANYWAGRNIQAPSDARNWAEVRRLVQGADAGLDRLVQICTDLLAI